MCFFPFVRTIFGLIFGEAPVTTSFRKAPDVPITPIQSDLNRYNYCERLLMLIGIEEKASGRDLTAYNLKYAQLRKNQDGTYQLKNGNIHDTESLSPGDRAVVTEVMSLSSTISYAVVTEVSSTISYAFVTKVDNNRVLLRFTPFFEKVYSSEKKFSVKFQPNNIPFKYQQKAIGLVQYHNVVSYLFPETINYPVINQSFETVYSSERKSVEAFKYQQKAVDIIQSHNVVSYIISEALINRYTIEQRYELPLLNNEQESAINNIFYKTSYPAPYLIFGPPGTGKTKTVVEAIYQIYSNKMNTRILICAPSNSAVDVLTRKLIDKNIPPTDLFRWYAAGYPKEEISSKILEYSQMNNQLLKARIVTCTLIQAGRLLDCNIRLPDCHFSYLFIDECGQAKESEVLIPIAALITSRHRISGQIVLSGDPYQLGPIIHSDLAKDLEISMLQRLMETNKLYKEDTYKSYSITELVMNYRSHPALLSVPNKLFYSDRLISCRDESHIIDWKYLKNPRIPLIFHDIKGTEQQDKNSTSFYNLREINAVIDYVQKLRMLFSESEIGIITPYNKQVQKLEEACKRIGCGNIKIGSVDKFQGDESLVIIISTVRSQESGKHAKIGFLKNPKRFNVAVTRAQALLIVIGNSTVLGTDTNWNTLLQFCMNNNCFIEDKEYTIIKYSSKNYMKKRTQNKI